MESGPQNIKPSDSIKAVNSNLNKFDRKGGKKLYLVAQGKSNKTPLKLSFGEIVQAKITNVFANELIEIDLPNGRFKAQVSGNFKSGDRLFFIVTDIKPLVHLKIHSIFVNEELEKDFDDIIRILNLKDDEIFKDIIKNNLKITKRLYRDVILRIYRQINKNEKLFNSLKFVKNPSMILLDYWSSGLPIEGEIFNNTIAAFLKVSYMETNLKDRIFIAAEKWNKIASISNCKTIRYLNFQDEWFRVENYKLRKEEFYKIYNKSNEYFIFKIVEGYEEIYYYGKLNKFDKISKNITKNEVNIKYIESSLTEFVEFTEHFDQGGSNHTFVI